METVFDNGYFYQSTIPDAVMEKLLKRETVSAEFDLGR